MDPVNGNERRPGGSVEPLDRTASLKAQFRIPDPMPRAHYELRDPFAEVTYRSHSFDDMVRKAERLGAVRFVAIAADGKRSTVTKSGTEWPRPEPAAVRPVPLTQVVPTTVPPQSKDAPGPEAAQAHESSTVQQPARIAALEATLNERYLIKRAPLRIGAVFIGQTEYRHRGDTERIAFTESTFRLATDSNSPSVARSMVDVAEVRGWSALRVSGHDDFRRMVWLEASLRNVKTVGYEPLPFDRELLEKERDARRPNRIEPHSVQAAATAPAEKTSARGGGSRKTVLAALEAVLIEQKVPTKRREAIMAVAAENLAERLRNGETHRIKVYDRSAPSQRTPPDATRQVQRSRDRPAPAR